MKPNTNFFVALCGVMLMLAEPALAQSIDLSPVQTLLQGIVDAITGPLGIVIGTLALIGGFSVVAVRCAGLPPGPLGRGGNRRHCRCTNNRCCNLDYVGS